MAAEGRGWIGSVVVHLGLLGAVIGFSWYAARVDSENVEPVDPLLIDLAGIPGKRPGEIGKAPGVAQGAETGTNNGIARVKIPKLNVQKILQDREQAEQAAQSSSNTKTSTKAVVKNGVGSKSSRMTLDEFNNSQGKSGRPGASAKSGGIGGVSVKKGRSYGTGDNGGEGGSASELAAYAGTVQAKLLTAWREIVAAEGESVATGGTCGVTVSVDASGFVSFSGWINSPRDARMAELVKRACAQIGNCGKPPKGKSFKIDFTRVSLSEA
ncbi:MAG: hypothetical protein RLZZ178_853 [Verrucomicrobiota bacterium]|jgi:hypothetical protein